MPRRPAKVTQSDIARAVRAAKETGASLVTIDDNGHIQIALTVGAVPTMPARDAHAVWIPSETLQRYRKRTESG